MSRKFSGLIESVGGSHLSSGPREVGQKPPTGDRLGHIGCMRSQPITVSWHWNSFLYLFIGSIGSNLLKPGTQISGPDVTDMSKLGIDTPDFCQAHLAYDYGL